MPNYETRTPEPVSVTPELGAGDVRVTASDRTGTVVKARPGRRSRRSDVKAAQRVRAGYANGMLRVNGPKARVFGFSRKTRSAGVAIELPSGSQVSAELQMGDVRRAGSGSAGSDLRRERPARTNRPAAPGYAGRSRHRRRHHGQRRDLRRLRQGPDRRGRGPRRWSRTPTATPQSTRSPATPRDARPTAASASSGPAPVLTPRPPAPASASAR